MTRLYPVRIVLFAMALATIFAFPAASHAQRRGAAALPTVTPPDENDYNVWKGAKDPDKKIKLGEDFVAKYPMSQYCAEVYDDLVNTYYMRENWNSFYATGDKAIAAGPDDVFALITVGWVIPHQYNSDDPDATKKLEKAATYEKHAIELLTAMQKPSKVTDEQFTSGKTKFLSEAHSGLGLVYFRNQDFDNAVKELQQATQTAESPDPTDLYALAISYEQINRYGDAADAFGKCAAIAGSLQDRCKQSAADDATKAAPPSK